MQISVKAMQTIWQALPYTMNSTKVQNPRRKMQVALLAEPKTPPGVERVYLILAMKCGGFFVHTMKRLVKLKRYPLHMRV